MQTNQLKTTVESSTQLKGQMKIQDRKRIIREYVKTLSDNLNKAALSEAWPHTWDGCHIRAIAAKFAEQSADFDSVKRAKREINKSSQSYALSLPRL